MLRSPLVKIFPLVVKFYGTRLGGHFVWTDLNPGSSIYAMPYFFSYKLASPHPPEARTLMLKAGLV